MIVNNIQLVTRNARGKVQVVILQLHQTGNTFIIKRLTGQHMGKMTEQPSLTIERGKSTRSVLQQAELEFNSNLRKYLDKGYKKLEDLTDESFDKLTVFDLDKLVPSIKTDSNGEYKPMLAKDYHKCQVNVLNKPFYASRKLNGVRCMMRLADDGKSVITISRGGKNYDTSAIKLREELFDLLSVHDDMILDGELYVHGMSLQEISGIARLETWDDRCNKLQYHIYDIASEKLTFEERLTILEDLQDVFKNSEKIFVLEHVYTESWEEIKRLHDRWVKEGYEGAVCRKPDKVYEFGKRGSTMIKVKEYMEDSFTIVDYSEKLRDEDFCFILETAEGKLFEAKPMGTREQKDEYLNNIDDLIGRKGDVKFFEWSKDNIPLQPVFMHVRYDI